MLNVGIILYLHCALFALEREALIPPYPHLEV